MGLYQTEDLKGNSRFIFIIKDTIMSDLKTCAWILNIFTVIIGKYIQMCVVVELDHHH